MFDSRLAPLEHLLRKGYSHLAEADATACMHLELGPQLFAGLDAESYLSDFLLPNLYFNLVTSYAILCNAGVPVGKADFMRHLAPRVQAR